MGAANSFTVDSHPAPGVILPGHCYRIRGDFPPAASPESPARDAGSPGRGTRVEPVRRHETVTGNLFEVKRQMRAAGDGRGVPSRWSWTIWPGYSLVAAPTAGSAGP